MLDFPGAVAADGIDAGVAAHYGDPVREWRLLREGRAFTDLSNREVIEVFGPDRLRWLHSLVSQSLENLPAGSSTEMLIFDPNGHISHAAAVHDDGRSTWLVADAGMGHALAEFLRSMVFMMRVEITERADLSAIGFFGEELPAAFTPLFLWRDPWPEVSPGGATYTEPGSSHPSRGWRRAIGVVENLEETAAILHDTGFSAAGTLAWEAARVEGWRPRPATEIVEKALPHELDWLRTAVHLSKGCYRGQETVAKVVNLGKPPRRFVELFLEGPEDELPAHGSPVLLGEREVGVVTSAVRHPEDGPIALALVRRSLNPAAELRVGNFLAGQEIICTTGGKSSASPRENPAVAFRKAQAEQAHRQEEQA